MEGSGTSLADVVGGEAPMKVEDASVVPTFALSHVLACSCLPESYLPLGSHIEFLSANEPPPPRVEGPSQGASTELPSSLWGTLELSRQRALHSISTGVEADDGRPARPPGGEAALSWEDLLRLLARADSTTRCVVAPPPLPDLRLEVLLAGDEAGHREGEGRLRCRVGTRCLSLDVDTGLGGPPPHTGRPVCAWIAGGASSAAERSFAGITLSPDVLRVRWVAPSDADAWARLEITLVSIETVPAMTPMRVRGLELYAAVIRAALPTRPTTTPDASTRYVVRGEVWHPHREDVEAGGPLLGRDTRASVGERLDTLLASWWESYLGPFLAAWRAAQRDAAGPLTRTRAAGEQAVPLAAGPASPGPLATVESTGTATERRIRLAWGVLARCRRPSWGRAGLPGYGTVPPMDRPLVAVVVLPGALPAGWAVRGRAPLPRLLATFTDAKGGPQYRYEREALDVLCRSVHYLGAVVCVYDDSQAAALAQHVAQGVDGVPAEGRWVEEDGWTSAGKAGREASPADLPPGPVPSAGEERAGTYPWPATPEVVSRLYALCSLVTFLEETQGAAEATTTTMTEVRGAHLSRLAHLHAGQTLFLRGVRPRPPRSIHGVPPCFLSFLHDAVAEGGAESLERLGMELLQATQRAILRHRP